jgi:hypothetical protein
MANKLYTHENVTYGARGRKWVFETPTYSYSTPVMPGGRPTADKIARIIAGGVKRGKGVLDNLGRANMHTVFHNAAKAQSNLILHRD